MERARDIRIGPLAPPRWRAAALTVVCVLFVAGCGSQQTTEAEQAKAFELNSELSSLGIEVPEGVVASLFGEDGGHLCAAADSPHDLAAVALAGHRFALRKTEVSTSDVAFARAVIEVYCPEDLETFDDYVAGLATGDTGDE